MQKISLASGSLGDSMVIKKLLFSITKDVDPVLIMNYEDCRGLKELRQEIININKLDLNDDAVLITSSAQQALRIIFTFLEERRIFVQRPTYFGALRIIKEKKKINFFDQIEELWNIDWDDGDVIYLTSNFHNPTAYSVNNEEKKKLAQMAKKKSVVIIEDNPYDLLYYEGGKRKNIFDYDQKQVIYVNSFSKILAPGLRVGYIIADPRIIQNLKSIKITEDLFTSTLNQEICLRAIKNNTYLDDLRKEFRKKRDIALQILKDNLSDIRDISWTEPMGGIFINIQFPLNIDMKEFIDLAQEKYNLILESDQYNFYDSRSRNTCRINFVQNSADDLRDGLCRLSEIIKILIYKKI